MPNPNVSLSIRDPGLGIVPASAGRTQVKLGVCQKGVPNSILSVGSINAARDLIGGGPILDAVAQVLAVAGGPVMVVPVLASAFGTVSSFALSGVGSGTIAGSRVPEQIVKVKIILGGTPGTMTFQIAVGSGAYGPTITSTADPFTHQPAGQQLTKLAFGNITYVATDVYQLNLDGTVSRTGSGPATALDGSTHSPLDAYDIWVQVTTTGALGAGAFRYSLDGGNNWSGSIGVPASGKYVIPATGVQLTFSGTFTIDDIYKGTATPPGFVNGDLTTALTALLANPTEWGFLHVVGTPSSGANAVALAAVVGAQMTSAFSTQGRDVWGLVECPQGEGDAQLKTDFASFVNDRIGVAAGDEDLQSVITGRRPKRNLAWGYAARLSATKLSAHPGQVAPDDNGGPIKNVLALYRDEAATPSLDEARFVTMRTIVGQPGYFITRGRMMAAPGSDYEQVMARRVMNRACTVARSAFALFLNRSVRVNADGHIDERDAQNIEAVVEGKLRAALVNEDEASDVRVSVSRDDNLLSTSTLNVEVEVIPKGYTEFIKVAIGFKNPALAAAAA